MSTCLCGVALPPTLRRAPVQVRTVLRVIGDSRHDRLGLESRLDGLNQALCDSGHGREGEEFCLTCAGDVVEIVRAACEANGAWKPPASGDDPDENVITREQRQIQVPHRCRSPCTVQRLLILLRRTPSSSCET